MPSRKGAGTRAAYYVPVSGHRRTGGPRGFANGGRSREWTLSRRRQSPRVRYPSWHRPSRRDSEGRRSRASPRSASVVAANRASNVSPTAASRSTCSRPTLAFTAASARNAGPPFAHDLAAQVAVPARAPALPVRSSIRRARAGGPVIGCERPANPSARMRPQSRARRRCRCLVRAPAGTCGLSAIGSGLPSSWRVREQPTYLAVRVGQVPRAPAPSPRAISCRPVLWRECPPRACPGCVRTRNRSRCHPRPLRAESTS